MELTYIHHGINLHTPWNKLIHHGINLHTPWNKLTPWN